MINKKMILQTTLFHLFPFGWCYSVVGVIIFWASIIAIKPYFLFDIKKSEGIILGIKFTERNEYSENGGKADDFISVKVQFKNKDVIYCRDSYSNIDDSKIGKIAEVKFEDNENDIFSAYNKILSIENKKVNNYYGESELFAIVLFLWGSVFLLLAYGDIKRNYRILLEKEKNLK